MLKFLEKKNNSVAIFIGISFLLSFILFLLNFKNITKIKYYNINEYILDKVSIFLKFNRLKELIFIDFLIILLYLLIIYCMYKKFKNIKKNYIKFLIFFLIHFIFCGILFLYIKNKNYSIFGIDIFKNFLNLKTYLKPNFSYNIFLPEGWKTNKFIIRDRNNFQIFKDFYIKIINTINYKDKNNNPVFFYNNIISRNLNKFKENTLKLNENLFIKNYIYNLINIDNLKNILSVDFFNFNKKFEKFSIKTSFNDLINLNLKGKNFFIKFLKLENFNVFSNKIIEGKNFFKNILENIKDFFEIKNFNNLNLGPSHRFEIFDEKKSFSLGSTTYSYPIKRENLKFNLSIYENKDNMNYLNLPVYNDTFYDWMRSLSFYNVFNNRLLVVNNYFKEILTEKFFWFKDYMVNDYFLNEERHLNKFNLTINKDKYLNTLNIYYNKFIYNSIMELKDLYHDNINRFLLKKSFQISKNSNKNIKYNDYEISYLEYILYNFKNIDLENFFFMKVNNVKKIYNNYFLVNYNKNELLKFIFIFLFLLFLILNYIYKIYF